MSRLALAILTSLVLVCSFSYPVQADTDHGEVDLTAEVVTYRITDLSASNPTQNSIDLTWTTPEAGTHAFSYFDLRYSKATITSDNWEGATGVVGEPSPVAGTSQGIKVRGLDSGTTYYFAIKLVDEEGIVGLLSNIASAATLSPPGGGGGGFTPTPPGPPPGTTDVSGIVSTAGIFQESVTALSENRLCTLDIPTGTVGLTAELEPLTEITIVIIDEPPAPPEGANVIGLAYDFGPDDAIFDPPITLTFSYDPADIPEGVAEEDMVIAWYDEAVGEWVELEGCVVDPETNTIVAPVSHFTAFRAMFIPAPAAFSLSTLAVSPAEAEIGSPIAISAVARNPGGKMGILRVILKIDGTVEQVEYIALDPGASKEVSFTTSRDTAGSYAVDINGLTGSFTVKEKPTPVPVPTPVPSEPVSWPVIGGIIAGIAALAAIIVAVLRRLGEKEKGVGT